MRKNDDLWWMRADGKTQVSIEYVHMAGIGCINLVVAAWRASPRRRKRRRRSLECICLSGGVEEMDDCRSARSKAC